MDNQINAEDFFKEEAAKRRREIISPENMLLWTEHISMYFLLESIPDDKKSPLCFWLGLSSSGLALFSSLKNQCVEDESSLICFYTFFQKENKKGTRVLEWRHDPPRMGESYLDDPKIIIQTKIRSSLQKLFSHGNRIQLLKRKRSGFSDREMFEGLCRKLSEYFGELDQYEDFRRIANLFGFRVSKLFSNISGRFEVWIKYPDAHFKIGKGDSLGKAVKDAVLGCHSMNSIIQRG